MRKQFGGHEEKQRLRLEVFADAEAAARAARRELIAEAAAQRAVEERGAFALALSGGNSPWRMFELLAEQRPRLERDRRSSRSTSGSRPTATTDRNLTHLLEHLPDGRVERLRPMPVDRRRPRGRRGELRGGAARSASTSSTSASGPTATPRRWCRATRSSTSTTAASR